MTGVQTCALPIFLPERADVVRAYGEQRELGLKLEHKYTHVGYTLGVYNGSGINTLDDNNQKDVALRLEAYPLEGVTLAAVGYRSLGERDKVESTRDRLEGDVALNFGDFVAQGEYIHAWDGATGDGATPRVEGAGWYGAVGYTFAKKLQPVVRLGRLDKNLDVADDTATTLDVGVNYFVSGDRVKLQAAYSHLGNQKAGYKPEQDVILAAQLKF